MTSLDFVQCPICYDIIPRNDICALHCGHLFHTECISCWVKQTNLVSFSPFFKIIFTICISINSVISTKNMHASFSVFAVQNIQLS